MLIETTEALAAFCDKLALEPYCTVDTEFVRDKTYYSQLCLVQLAGKAGAVAVDPLAPGIDLQPLFDLMNNEKVLKVFHAARQDLEIFFLLMGRMPAPLWDSQVAAMVCGFGESASYETLATKLAGARIDKSSRFTDWSRRPLTQKQSDYAISDVTHLRTIYELLSARIAEAGRGEWVAEELAHLTDPSTYRSDPDRAWMRLKPRTSSPKFLSILKELAAWREVEAQKRNLPRQRILKDDALLEIAAQAPASADDLANSRAVGKGFLEGSLGEGFMAAVQRGRATPNNQAPTLPERPELPPGRAPLVDLLKVLLKLKCEANDVAQKLIATADDLNLLAMDDAPADLPCLNGWRKVVFGDDALALKSGKMALTARNGAIDVVKLG